MRAPSSAANLSHGVAPTFVDRQTLTFVQVLRRKRTLPATPPVDPAADTRIDQIGQELAGADRGQLIHVADKVHRTVAGTALSNASAPRAIAACQPAP
jgi:hypothetical protein